MSGPFQSFTLPTRFNTFPTPQHIDLAFKPRVMFMLGSAIASADMGTWFENSWSGFGWSRDPSFEAASVGSSGWETGHIAGGSYISESIFAGLYEDVSVRAKQIDLISLDCDTATGHATSGYTFETSVTLPTQVVPTLALGGDNISVSTGSFNWPGAAGDVAVSGLGFEPQLVMLLWSKTDVYNRPYTFGDASGASAGHGAASSADTSEQFAHYGMEAPGPEGWTVHTPGKIAVVHDSSVVLASAVLSSMDADGFTLSFDGPDTGEPLSVVPRLIGWIALRDSVGGFRVGNETVPGSTGTVGYTGCGFTPDQVITSHGNASAANTVEFGGSWGIGMFDDTLQSSFVSGPNLTVGPAFAAHRMTVDSAIQFGTTNAASTDGEANRVSMDSDGFTLDWTNVGAPGRPWGWVAMKTTGLNFGGTCGGISFVPQIYRWIKK